MPHKIILDCDPGHDDVFALLLAVGSPEIELLAVTTVAGNQTLDKVTRNARSALRVFGLSGVPIAAGCARPMVREQKVAADVHGESGLDGVDLPEPVEPLDERHAVDVIIDTVMTHDPGTVTLVAVGALTNVAMAVRKEPRLASRVRQVVLMGGGYHAGNRTPVAEFNVWVDPESAHVVFNEDWPLLMVGLDLTYQALATREVTDRIAAVGTAPARFVGGLLNFSGSTYMTGQGFDAPPVHDPCAVAYVIDPSVMTTRVTPLDVELSGSLTAGMTVADLRRPAPEGCTTSVAVELNHQRFWDLVVDALERVGEVGA